MNFEQHLKREKEKKSILGISVKQRSPGKHPRAGQGRSVNVCTSAKDHGDPM